MNNYSFFNISIGKDYCSPDYTHLYSFGVLTEDVWTKSKRRKGESDLSWGGENWSEKKKKKKESGTRDLKKHEISKYRKIITVKN